MRTCCVKKGLVVGVILLFIGIAVQPAIANDITIFNEKFKKYESNSKLTNFWDIILFLLNLFENILNKIKQIIDGLISCILFLFILLFFG